MEYPTITIGCPIANRIYLIDKYLDGIQQLDYPKDKIKLYFLVNNCRDGTDIELKKFRDRNKHLYMDIVIEKYKMTFKKDERTANVREGIYRRLAELRNYVLTKIDTDYFFSVDSDIILSPNSLLELVKAKKDIIACIINNDQILRPYKKYPEIRTNLLIDHNRQVTHYLNFPLNEIIEVGYTGAVYLMTNEVTKRVRYDYSSLGEDIPFCATARQLGYKIYAHTGLWQQHIMCEYQSYCIENKCLKPCFQVDLNTYVYKYRYIDNVVLPLIARCPNLVSGVEFKSAKGDKGNE